MPAEQPHPDLSTALADDATGRITVDAPVIGGYEAQGIAHEKRFAAVVRCFASVGGSVTVMSSVGAAP